MNKKKTTVEVKRECGAKNSASPENPEQVIEMIALNSAVNKIKHKILVLSGKGGVGKSTVAANMAVALSLKGKKVGLMDIDVHGPSIPKLLGLEGRPIRQTPDGLQPIVYNDNLKVISIGFMLKNEKDAVIWRAPLKHSLIKQFLTDMEWGELDYLIVDCPPGTGDEPLSIIQLLGSVDGGVIVTTPQDVSLTDVRKSITFCHQVNIPVLGLIENMSGFICPNCGERHDIFKSGGGERLASEMRVAFLGRIPLEPRLVASGDDGKPYLEFSKDSPTAMAFNLVLEPIIALAKDKKEG